MALNCHEAWWSAYALFKTTDRAAEQIDSEDFIRKLIAIPTDSSPSCRTWLKLIREKKRYSKCRIILTEMLSKEKTHRLREKKRASRPNRYASSNLTIATLRRYVSPNLTFALLRYYASSNLTITTLRRYASPNLTFALLRYYACSNVTITPSLSPSKAHSLMRLLPTVRMKRLYHHCRLNYNLLETHHLRHC